MNIAEAVRTRSFSLGRRRKRRTAPEKGKNPQELFFSHRDLSRRTGYPYVNFVTDFNISTWLTAIAGSAVLLLAYHLVTRQGNTGRTRRRAGWAHR